MCGLSTLRNPPWLVAVVLSALQVVHGHGAAVEVDVVAALAVGEDLDALDKAGGVGPRPAVGAVRVSNAEGNLDGLESRGEKVEVLRSSLHGVVRVLQAAQLHLRLQEAVLLPGRGATFCPEWASKWILEPASLSQKVTNAPMSFVKARATVTLCSATPFGTLDCCVHRGVAEHQGPS